jgi:Fungal Transforming acidic coiled-coil (TACC) proteins
MAQALSPLSSSRCNTRHLSPDSPSSTARRRGIEEIIAQDDDKENQSPNPAKRLAYNIGDSMRDNLKCLAYDEIPCTATGEVIQDVTESPPSSPFQFDARNDTVDLRQAPKEGSMSPPSVNISFSPKKVRDNILVDFEVAEDQPPSQGLYGTAEAPREGFQDPGYGDRQECEAEADVGASLVRHGFPTENDRLYIGNSIIEDKHNEEMSTVCREEDDDLLGCESMASDVGNDAMISAIHDPMDDTCLSTFSAVPNADMTLFAKLRGSPTKDLQDLIDLHEPAFKGSPSRILDTMTPCTARNTGTKEKSLFDVDSPVVSPTPHNNNDTANLLEFTDQINYFTRVSQRYAAQNSCIYSPHHRPPLKVARESLRTPGKFSLLDFDIPPAPTPRSIPTITPRELESLKSSFLSEVSSLKATLSGKEAEVASLKQAVADAERRVGEASEEVRNEAARREALEVEHAAWERRGAEMENILRGVKADILEGERERDLLMKRLEDADKCREQFEGRVVELESQLSAARNGATATQGTISGSDSRNTKTAEEVAREVQDAVERVARELHALYKGKHETKVAALKKSYEARWEKRVREAENQLREAIEENERLKSERDVTMSGPMNPNTNNDECEAEKRVLEAHVKGLQQEMAAIKRDNERLHSELKIERTEKGELVAAVDEWLAMQQIQNQAPKALENAMPAQPQEQAVEAMAEETESAAPTEPESPSRSVISRTGASGIRLPSGGKSGRLGGHGNGHARARSGTAIPTPGRSGIMNSIERMGRGGN